MIWKSRIAQEGCLQGWLFRGGDSIEEGIPEHRRQVKVGGVKRCKDDGPTFLPAVQPTYQLGQAAQAARSLGFLMEEDEQYEVIFVSQGRKSRPNERAVTRLDTCTPYQEWFPISYL